jgi:peptide-methionine (S)-S-oxide reductase
MSSRTLAASLTIAAILGLAGVSPGQDAASPVPPPQPKAKSDPAADKPGPPQEMPNAAKPGTPQDKPASDKPASDKPVATKTSTEKAEPKGPKMEKATFGGGCFWSFEATFERVPGVKSVTSGFAGGNVPNPSYQMVCTGETGHAEVIQVEYDASVVTYDKLLNLFWHAHDPTQVNMQGDDVGTQYRSIILYHNEAQRQAALKSHKEIVARRLYRGRIATQLVPLNAFFPAEPYHQDYFVNHPDNEYSSFYIIPKLIKLRKSKLIK